MNLSGMQRMLSQRIAKSYLMIGAEVRSEQALQQLDQSVARFENNYQALAEYAPSAEIGAALEQVGESWQHYRELALSRPTREQAVLLLALSDQLLAQSEALVQLIEAHTGSAGARLVNRSGRQRMLSQRIAKLYLALSWRPAQGASRWFVEAGTGHISVRPQPVFCLLRVDLLESLVRFTQAGGRERGGAA